MNTETYVALRDCVITGHDGVVREGERVALTRRQAKYELLKGRIETTSAHDADPAPPPRRRRPRKGA